MTGIVCLAEDSYWNGVCALINSLSRHNFKGCLFVGYRGDIPRWLCQFNKKSLDTYEINDNLIIRINFLITKRHLGYEKPFYLSNIINSYDLSEIFYFDTDCIPIADYSFYKKWTSSHITLCSDENYDYVHENHPWRLEWIDLLTKNNIVIEEMEHKYINSGYIGIPAVNFNLINSWKSITLYLEKNGLCTIGFNKNPIHSIQGDQEILNMALYTVPKKNISIIGKEGMGFQEPLYLMIHCTSPKKPWAKNFLWEFIKNGVLVSPREKKYLSYLNNPFTCCSKTKFALHVLNLRFTVLLSRIF